jgi:hypothetical protein
VLIGQRKGFWMVELSSCARRTAEGGCPHINFIFWVIEINSPLCVDSGV